MRNKQYAVTTVQSLVRDVDLDECSEHEMEPLGDAYLFDLMRVSPLSHTFTSLLSILCD